MLKIRTLKININTDKGLYGVSVPFSDGLNIIRGNNSSGKSTIFQSILYCLGMEELLGSKNDKAMQSVLKNEVLDNSGEKEATVLESTILLEIENESIITVERVVKHESKSPKLVKVHYGSLLSEQNTKLDYDEMFIHDKGSAQDVKYGFFAYLESFLGLHLPEVKYNDGSFRKLYLQTIFPSFIIEQKVGWSDFLATIPYYQLHDREKRAIEFILGLDSWKIEERKQEIRREKQLLSQQWQELFIEFRDLAKRASCEIKGIEDTPAIFTPETKIYLLHRGIERSNPLGEYIRLLEEEYVQLNSETIPKIEEIAKDLEDELNSENDKYRQYVIHLRNLNNRSSMLLSNLGSIKERLTQIEEELIQNKHHLKVKSLGADNDIKIAKDICPTCNHGLNDTLLPVDSNQIPMTIEENIGYLESQRAMARTYIKNHKNEITEIERKTNALEDTISECRGKIRSLKRDLVSDDRLPSVELLENRIKLQNQISFYNKVQDDVESYRTKFEVMSSDWEKAKGDEEKLPKDSFSDTDKKKLWELNKIFISLLRRYGYKSKSLEDIRISYDKLLPVAENYYNIRFDSSASDLVRAIWAYTISLFSVSDKFSANHPKFIMMDEPGTQDTANESLNAMLKDLSNNNLQAIICASFKQSDNDFKESTKDVPHNLIHEKSAKYIQKLKKVE